MANKVTITHKDDQLNINVQHAKMFDDTISNATPSQKQPEATEDYRTSYDIENDPEGLKKLETQNECNFINFLNI